MPTRSALSEAEKLMKETKVIAGPNVSTSTSSRQRPTWQEARERARQGFRNDMRRHPMIPFF